MRSARLVGALRSGSGRWGTKAASGTLASSTQASIASITAATTDFFWSLRQASIGGRTDLTVFSMMGPSEAPTTPSTCNASATRFLLESVRRFFKAEMNGETPLGWACLCAPRRMSSSRCMASRRFVQSLLAKLANRSGVSLPETSARGWSASGTTSSPRTKRRGWGGVWLATFFSSRSTLVTSTLFRSRTARSWRSSRVHRWNMHSVAMAMRFRFGFTELRQARTNPTSSSIESSPTPNSSTHMDIHSRTAQRVLIGTPLGGLA
mmetsp:Transcript_23063/g.64790  ORF Transcript_23063/g.64790 Transcript_23063/m.64790 type:complete len:265 (+) Transcript_23063:151-945(+)